MARRVDQLMAHLVSLVADAKLAKLRTYDVDGVYAQLRARGLSPKSIKLTHATLRQVFDQAVQWGWISVNPTPAKGPAAVRSEPTPPSRQKMARLIDVAAEIDPAWG